MRRCLGSKGSDHRSQFKGTLGLIRLENVPRKPKGPTERPATGATIMRLMKTLTITLGVCALIMAIPACGDDGGDGGGGGGGGADTGIGAFFLRWRLTGSSHTSGRRISG